MPLPNQPLARPSTTAQERQRLIGTLRSLFTMFIASYLYNLAITDKNHRSPRALLHQSFQSVWNLFGGPFSTALFFSNGYLDSWFGSFYPFLPDKIAPRRYMEFRKLQHQLMSHLPNISSELQATVGTVMSELNAVLTKEDETYISTSTTDCMTTYLRTILEIINAQYCRGFNLTEIPTLTSKIDRLLSTHPEHIRDGLNSYLRPLLALDVLDKQHRNKCLQFSGPSGVGKTALTKSVFKDTLGFNVCFTTLTDFFRNSHGTPSEPYKNFRSENTSVLVNAISSLPKSQNRRYTVFVFDEADKNSHDKTQQTFNIGSSITNHMDKLLEITEPNTRYYTDPPSGIIIDLKYVLFVFISNEDNITGTALERRVNHFKFTKLSADLKEQISQNRVSEYLEELPLSLNEEQRTTIQDMIKANDKPGVGELLDDLKLFLDNLHTNSIFVGTSWQLDSKELLFRFRQGTNDIVINKPSLSVENQESDASLLTGENPQVVSTTSHNLLDQSRLDTSLGILALVPGIRRFSYAPT